MSVPMFTGEYSLFKSTANYCVDAANNSRIQSEVVPAMQMRDICWSALIYGPVPFGFMMAGCYNECTGWGDEADCIQFCLNTLC